MGERHSEVHAIIRQAMGYRQKTDNLPWGDKGTTRLLLADCFKALGCRVGVEVGTQWGYYAKALCERNPDLRLTCVDPWAAYHGTTQEKQDQIHASAVARLAPFNVTILRQPSLAAVDSFKDGALDFVYIDGDHTFDAVMQDIIRWAPKVRHGGIVACHDFYHFKWSGIVEAVEAYVRCHDIRPWYVTREEEPSVFWVNP